MQAAKRVVTIDVFSDNICPWCFVGKRNLDAAIRRNEDKFEFRIQWHPFFLDPSLPAEGETLDSYLMRRYGRRMNGADLSNPLNVAGRKAGIAFNNNRLMHNTMDSHRLIAFANKQGKQHETVEALFKEYFENAANIADQSVLLRIAAEVGLENAAPYLESDEDKDKINREYESTLRERIGGVPFYKIRGADASAAPIKLSGAQPTEAFEEAFEEATD